MIVDFADAGTADIFNGLDTSAARKVLTRNLWGIAQRKLDSIQAARSALDLKSPPGNRLEALKGDLKGFYSIRINDQFRVIFTFQNGQAGSVQITDYH